MLKIILSITVFILSIFVLCQDTISQTNVQSNISKDNIYQDISLYDQYIKVAKNKFIEITLEDLKKFNIEYKNGTMYVPMEMKIFDKANENRQTLLKKGYNPDEEEYYRKMFKFSISGISSNYIQYDGWNKSICYPLLPIAVTSSIIRNDKHKNFEVNLFLFNEKSPYLSSDQNLIEKEINEIAKEFISRSNAKTFININDYEFINYLVPVKISFNDKIKYRGKTVECNIEYIFWYIPSKELINSIPKVYAEELIKELQIIEDFKNGEIVCDNIKDTLKGKDSYLNIGNYNNNIICNSIVYPNPAQTNFSVKFKLQESRFVSITIFELSGQLLPQDKYTYINTELQAGEHIIPITLNNIARGIYLISISTTKGEQVVLRLIID